MNSTLRDILLAALACITFSTDSAFAQAVLDDEHVDIGIGYANDVWDLHVHDESHDVEYDPDDALLYIGALDPPVTQPTGSEWDFIGAGAGNPFCLLPTPQFPGLLFLGFAAEEVAPGTFASYFEADPRVSSTAPWIKMALVDVRGPGQFSVWSTDAFGLPTAWMFSFANGITADDAVFILEGGHNDFNFGFTETGFYDVDFEASGFLADGTPVNSGPVTYHFGVKVVPEPGAGLLAGLAVIGVAVTWRRRTAH